MGFFPEEVGDKGLLLIVELMTISGGETKTTFCHIGSNYLIVEVCLKVGRYGDVLLEDQKNGGVSGDKSNKEFQNFILFLPDHGLDTLYNYN